jgi:DNA-binding LytR/AlgR family response regulator
MCSIKTILVDDEPIARRILREELEVVPDVEIVAEADSGRQALEKIQTLKPDLVLLDLQMPGMNGFEVVRRIEGSHLPCIVIVTAYDHYAIQAFEAGAIDYLLKPVSSERLHHSLERVRQLRKSNLAVAESVAQLQEAIPVEPISRPRKIVGRVGDEYFLLESSQVLAFQAERELVWIITRKQRYLATQTLRVIQQKLSHLHFARIHRNCLINMEHVAKMAPLSSQRWLLTLDNQQEFVVSKRQAHEVQRLLTW